MTTYDACAIIEGFDGEDHTEDDIIEAFQFLIDDGIIWRLQGFYGRAAKQLIDNGVCQMRG